MTKPQKTEFWKAYRYLRRHRRLMDYAGYRRRGLPIGSGVTEAACKTVFTQRFKRSGMRWSHEAGQVILTARGVPERNLGRGIQNRLAFAGVAGAEQRCLGNRQPGESSGHKAGFRSSCCISDDARATTPRGPRFQGCRHRQCRGFPQKVGRNKDSLVGPWAKRTFRAGWPDDRDCVGHALCRLAVVRVCPSSWWWRVWAWSKRTFRIFVRRNAASIPGFRLGGYEPARPNRLRAERPADVEPSNNSLADEVR